MEPEQGRQLNVALLWSHKRVKYKESDSCRMKKNGPDINETVTQSDFSLPGFGISFAHLQCSTAIINVACNPQGSKGWLPPLHWWVVQKSVLHVLPRVPLSTPPSRTFFPTTQEQTFCMFTEEEGKRMMEAGLF